MGCSIKSFPGLINRQKGNRAGSEDAVVAEFIEALTPHGKTRLYYCMLDVLTGSAAS